MNYNDWLTKRERYTPDYEAVIDLATENRYSYRDLNRRANNLATVLQRDYSLKAGNRVAVLSKNRMEMIDLFFACGKLGVIMVPLNFRLPAPAIEELLHDCDPSLLVYSAEFDAIAASAKKKKIIPKGFPIEGKENSVEQIVLADQSAPKIHIAKARETAMILYTSGTTGKSKGAMISWRQIHWNSINSEIGLELTSKDCAIVNTPFYHTGGWHVLFTPLIHHAGKIILQSEFDPAESLKIIKKERITILFGIPTMLKMIMDEESFSDTDFSSVRYAICGGEACPIPVINRYKEVNIPIRQGYGLTEAGPNCYSLPAEDAIRKEGSVGFPNFHIGVKVVANDGSEVEQGEIGELWMKGPHVFNGYWNNPEATNETLENGWVKTGDLFRQDKEGYFYIAGRKKDMYISGGENVYPVQVENVIYEHPAVSQAAVIGVPDDQWGETGCAFVVLKDQETLTSDELKTYCRDYLAGFQCPGHVIFQDELPLGHSNKIQKKELYTLFEKLIESGEL